MRLLPRSELVKIARICSVVELVEEPFQGMWVGEKSVKERSQEDGCGVAAGRDVGCCPSEKRPVETDQHRITLYKNACGSALFRDILFLCLELHEAGEEVSIVDLPVILVGATLKIFPLLNSRNCKC